MLVDGDGSNDDNKVLGATSGEGMLLMHDDAIIESIRVKMVEGLPLRPDSLCKGQVSDKVEGKTNDTAFDDVEVVYSTALDTWVPFGGIVAPEGYTYIGKLAFICFGPTSKFFAGTLAMGGQSNRSVKEKKEGSRKAMHKISTERANIN